MTNNPLPGNPHLNRAEYVEIDGAPYAIAQATLALAYEQRTANLIALEALLHGSGADIEVTTIQERLGLS